MSAVKNLRAMFEQKQDASPPDRGRSPGLSSNGTETPPPSTRPLSKIRTSFVAIEKDGRVGLRRDPSNESSLSQRRLSSHTEGEASVSGQSDKTMATEETSGGFKTSILGETIPESPRRAEANKSANGSPARNLGALTDKPSHNPDKHVDVETPTPELLPGDPTQKTPAQPSASNSPAAVKKTTKPKDAAKPAPKTLAPPATIKARSKTPTRSPTTAKAPSLHSGTKPSAPKHEPAKKTTEKLAATTAAAKSGTRATGAAKKPAPVNVSPPKEAGFVKPKPKSPTRPVRLPASLMAPTAASVSKVKGETPRETLSRASGNQGRPASRASAAGAGPTKTLKRQNSVINRPRPSIGPPPKKPLQDHPITKKEKEVDENFLARMMRPTQSSSSKTTEKAPVTPPRHRSSTQGSGKQSSVSASRSPRRTMKPSPDSARTGSPFARRAPHIEQVAPETAQVETAEEVVEAAQQVEEPVEVKAEPEPVKAPATPEPIPEESSSDDKTTDPEPTAVTSGSDGVNDQPESPEFEELAQRAARLSIDESDNHELKSPDEFEELLEEEQAEAPAAPSQATTEVKTETA
ncbi:hypothetical protein CkaCkLH20_05800 [Colletotrichum karsti]|uniref:Mucin-7 n=1 Tax=Colletotrichum karsti TaxID=1095194 RepID=A0A9P6I6L9_9PEZI|nr:uncharacterized protein CkaCkLH20_05800 [Colletotrichum karsti]KAF9876954.1 hypothetical protein CkaCkLH20_05800 [Colletotrichum karsti]